MYKNMIDCFVKVIREEGPGGLYKGLTPALLRQASYSSLRMGIYEPIRFVRNIGPCGWLCAYLHWCGVPRRRWVNGSLMGWV